jgi:hypothetical protein
MRRRDFITVIGGAAAAWPFAAHAQQPERMRRVGVLMGYAEADPAEIAAFKEINPEYLIPGHCAGERFYDLVRAEMPDKVIHSAVGTRFVFAA